ncbi:MAG: TIGR04283 family arsenosugar biosynthesis glycosyltransferase [Acidobacteriaceae bacterium]|nr:TIGR04283 family arsenosugar biosynthesis glycosyltransferase [Acidobacteriaceae bacterium]MBV9501690.1 TIGR04283 family arsenosugar biosynthesis glycosyltransferase [Acidobacteriaceae bacterium]
MLISIVVPALNEGSQIGTTLDALARLAGEKEIIVVDGGSEDRTIEIASRPGIRTLCCERGRGHQMHAAALTATGDVLWFVHADTIPPVNALERIENALRNPGISAGNFGLTFEGASRAARLLTTVYPLLRFLGLCYGDSGIFVRRSVYQRVGGFRRLALFEDLDLLRRLRRQGRFARLECRIITSSRRFENRNFAAMWLHWTTLQILYWLGCPPNWLARWYGHTRRAD